MLNFFRQRRARPLIAKALAEHATFEAEHRIFSAKLHEAHEITRNAFRTVEIAPGTFRVRDLGEYDRDQKIERIAGEVTRAMRRPPKNLRKLIGAAL
jgi:hypothetical protein